MKRNNYSIIDFPKIIDPRGNLTVAESMQHVPFDVYIGLTTFRQARAVADMPTSNVAR